MNRYRLTIVGSVLAISIYLINNFLEINIFTYVLNFFASLEKSILELIVLLGIVVLFVSIDYYRNSRESQLEKAKRNIYKAMLCSSHHILNSFLYQMDIFKITAEHTPGFDAKTLAFYEDIVDDTSDKIQSLSNLKSIDEFSIKTSVMTK
ncbi:hypothetical protein [Aquimarina brevivitae]|uniref:Histidine kinase n=1 Tax=Aquimarina brevivitae TaxID=323412 RepID=A0A4Q7NWF2_9FLAO|nr:hypothetical protein [Aquimarina brevivitae]RZS90732.1 hypothetical protein EV197_3263 [Aquimarina brevivitae]